MKMNKEVTGLADYRDDDVSAQRQAYFFIREKIMSGAYAGGEKINPIDVAEELDISRMPVREALVQLDAEGLVTLRRNRGATVTALTPDDVQELFEMRAALEALAVREALPHLDHYTYAELDGLLRRMNVARDDPHLWIQRHHEFHDFLCSQSRRPRLVREISKIRNSIHPYLLLYMSVYHTAEMEGAEHQSLIDALKTGNGHLVERVIRDHILTASDGVIEFLRNRFSSRKL